MIKYIATETVDLTALGRKRSFTKDEEVFEDAYTATYPSKFKRIGVVLGYSSFLTKPYFVPDKIEEFVQKENVRKEELVTMKEVEIEDLPDEDDFSEIEDVTEDEVTIEIEE